MYFSITLMIISSLIINLINGESVDGDDGLLRKTYCLSFSGSTLCSGNNLLTAQWIVQRLTGKEIDSMKFILIGRNIKANEEKSISMKFRSSSGSSSFTIFTCFKASNGSTKSRVSVNGSSTINNLNSTSKYSNSVLNCSWSLGKSFKLLPFSESLHWTEKLVPKPGYVVELQYGDESSVVNPDPTKLRVGSVQNEQKFTVQEYGNKRAHIKVSRKGDKINYRLEIKINRTEVVNVYFIDRTNKKGRFEKPSLFFNCNFELKKVNMSLSLKNDIKLISKLTFQKIDGNFCEWSHDNNLTYTMNSGRDHLYYDATYQPYEMIIFAQGYHYFHRERVQLPTNLETSTQLPTSFKTSTQLSTSFEASTQVTTSSPSETATLSTPIPKSSAGIIHLSQTVIMLFSCFIFI